MSKTIINDDETMQVEYSLRDVSFDHEFGTLFRKDHDIKKIEVWLDIIDDWIDVTEIENEKLQREAIALIQSKEEGETQWSVK